MFACSNPARIAPWGELLSTAAQVRGAAGALMDGCTRDIKAIRAMNFPVFHGGIAPLDSKGRGRVMALDVPVRCAGVKVATGDLVFGDADGVVVIPRAVEEKVLDARVRQDQGREAHARRSARGREARRRVREIRDPLRERRMPFRCDQPAVPTVQQDDATVRITRWDFAVGAATGWHTHGWPYFVVMLTDAVMKIEANGAVNEVRLVAGQSYQRPSGIEHDVMNGSDHPIAFVEIEIKRPEALAG